MRNLVLFIVVIMCLSSCVEEKKCSHDAIEIVSVTKNYKTFYGVMKGCDTLLSAKYTTMVINDGYILAGLKKDGGYGQVIYNSQGEVVLPFSHNQYVTFFKDVVLIRESDNWNHRVVFVFDLQTKNKYSVPNELGPIQFIENEGSFYGYYISKDNHIGFLDKKMEVVVPAEKYKLVKEVAGAYFYNSVHLTLGDKHGYWDTDGNIVVPFEYDNGVKLSSDLITVIKNGKWSVYNVKNKTQSSASYMEQPKAVGGYFYSVQDNGCQLMKAIDHTKAIDHPLKWVEALTMDWKGLYILTDKDGKLALINDKTKLLLPFEYQSIGVDPVSKNFVALGVNNKYSYYNKSTNKVAKDVSDKHIVFDGTTLVAKVHDGTKISTLDTLGNIINANNAN